MNEKSSLLSSQAVNLKALNDRAQNNVADFDANICQGTWFPLFIGEWALSFASLFYLALLAKWLEKASSSWLGFCKSASSHFVLLTYSVLLLPLVGGR